MRFLHPRFDSPRRNCSTPNPTPTDVDVREGISGVILSLH